MAEVHNITRTAFEQIGDFIYDECNGYGDYLVMSCIAEFDGGLVCLFLEDRYESEHQARRIANRRQAMSLHSAYERGKFCIYYEVWHIVPDPEPDFVVLAGQSTLAVTLPCDYMGAPIQLGAEVVKVDSDGPSYYVTRLELSRSGWIVRVSLDGRCRCEKRWRPQWLFCL